jgi:PPP family 3-phenylpropionic acid transporter
VSARVRAAAAYVALYTAIAAEAPYLVLFYRSLGFELWAIGAVAAGAGVLALVAGPLWGATSDRARGSPVILLGPTTVALAGAAVLGTAGAAPQAVLGAALLAVGLAGLSPIIDARALETSPDRSRYGPLRAWGSISYVAGAAATGAAIDLAGIRVAFAILAGALLATGLIGLTLRPAARAAVRPDSPLRAAGRLFGRGGLGPFLVGTFLTWMAMSAVGGYYALRLQELGAPASTVGAAAAVGAAVEVPIMLAFPAVVARLGAERVLVLGALVFASRGLVAAVATDPALLVVASAVNGIGFACFLVGGVTYVSRHAPPALAATAQSVFQGFGIGLGQIVAAAGGGAIASAVGIPGLFLTSGILGVAAAGIVAVATLRGATPAAGPTSAAGPTTSAAAASEERRSA